MHVFAHISTLYNKFGYPCDSKGCTLLGTIIILQNEIHFCKCNFPQITRVRATSDVMSLFIAILLVSYAVSLLLAMRHKLLSYFFLFMSFSQEPSVVCFMLFQQKLTCDSCHFDEENIQTMRDRHDYCRQ